MKLLMNKETGELFMRVPKEKKAVLLKTDTAARCSTCSHYKNKKCKAISGVVQAHSLTELDYWLAAPKKINACTYYDHFKQDTKPLVIRGK